MKKKGRKEDAMGGSNPKQIFRTKQQQDHVSVG
jgi:hypothetical protein